MALAACRECGQGVSTEAPSCPNCGAPEPTRRPPAPAQPSARPAWQPGMPYPDHLIPETDASGAGLLRRPKRAAGFRVGDRVRANRLADEGTGTILDVSFQLNRGVGTKLYPSFLVQFEGGRRDWYTGSALTKVY